MKAHLAVGANSLSYNHNTCIHKQMSYVFRCLEMVWFPHNCFVEIFRIQADSKLHISMLVFALNKQETIYPWGSFMNWFQNSCFQHLIHFLLESFFQVNWNQSTRVCFSVTFGSHWIWYEGPGMHPIPSNTSWYLYKIWCLPVTNLETTCCWFNTVDSWFELWVDTSCLELWTDTLDMVFFGWSLELVIKLTLGGK